MLEFNAVSYRCYSLRGLEVIAASNIASTVFKHEARRAHKTVVGAQLSDGIAGISLDKVHDGVVLQL